MHRKTSVKWTLPTRWNAGMLIGLAMSPLFSFSEWSTMRAQSLPFAYLAF